MQKLHPESIFSPTSLTVAEGGSDTYEVNLTTLPTGPVTVTPSVADNSDVTVDPTSLTFTTANWNDVQEVTVSAAQDADADTDTATVEHSRFGCRLQLGARRRRGRDGD